MEGPGRGSSTSLSSGGAASVCVCVARQQTIGGDGRRSVLGGRGSDQSVAQNAQLSCHVALSTLLHSSSLSMFCVWMPLLAGSTKFSE